MMIPDELPSPASAPERGGPLLPKRARAIVVWVIVLLCTALIAWESQREVVEVDYADDSAPVELEFLARVYVAFEYWQPDAPPDGAAAVLFDHGNSDEPAVPEAANTALDGMWDHSSTAGGARRLGILYAYFAADIAADTEAIAMLRHAQGLRTEWLSSGDVPLGQRPALRAANITDEVLIRAFYAGVIDSQDAEQLRSELGWFGDLAVAAIEGPDSNAAQAATAAAARGTLLICVLMFIVPVMIITGFVLWFMGYQRVKDGRLTSQLPADVPYDRTILIEALAVYLVASIVASIALPDIGGGIVFGLLGIVCVSVLGVCWPLLRGVPPATYAADIGLHRGEGFWTEVRAGIVGYSAVLPLVMIGALATIGLNAIHDLLAVSGTASAHPIVDLIARGNGVTQVVAITLAAMVAPLFEEMLFRGAMYGHLRENRSRWWSLLVMSFIFAAIHPQGWTAIPVLMSLAIGFALMREWRGSLIAPMTAHALHNGTITLTLLVVFI